MKFRYIICSQIIVLAVVLLGSAPAFSQEDTESALIEEIVVTAQKREELLQEVPMSISAFSAAALESRRIEDIADLAIATPNFTVSSFTGNRPEFTIRGIGTSGVIRASLDTGVSVFVDEFYISRSDSAIFDFYDIEQVAVLRGPQGTLFGKNVVGGAVLITTAKPNLDSWGSKILLGVGNEGRKDVKAVINGPLSENVAAKLSVLKTVHDGWGRDLITGQELDDKDLTGLRGQLLYAPSDSFEMLLSVDYTTLDGNSSTQTELDRGLTSYAAVSDQDLRTSAHGVPQEETTDNSWLIGLKMNWNLASGTVTSLTGYRTLESTLFESFVPEAIPNNNTQVLFDQIEDPDSITQELRFTSDNEGPLNYVAGLFLNSESVYRQECEQIIAGTDLNGNRTPPFLGPGVGFPDGDTSLSCWDMYNDTDGWAVFLDGTYEISDRTRVRAGIRYTADTKTTRTVATIVDPFENGLGAVLNEGFDVTSKDTFSGATPRLVFEWDAGADAMLYASASRGFKAGGFDQLNNGPATANSPFFNEEAWNYEIGLRSLIANGRLKLNTTVFHTDFDNLQRLILAPTGGLALINAAEATIRGAEVELLWAPTESFQLSADYGYLDASYDRYIVPANGQDRSASDVPKSPKNSINLAANYVFELDRGGEIVANAVWNWTDEFYFGDNPNSLAQTFQESYSVINASLAYQPSGTNLRFTLWGKNLSDEEYFKNKGSLLGSDSAKFAPPLLYGLDIQWSTR